MTDIFSYNFMINALIAGVLTSIALGLIGSYIVVKRIVFISGGISHAAYGGIGLAIFIGIQPFWGAVISGILTAIFIAVLRKHKYQNEDILIGIIWAIGMAIGIIFTSLTPGYVPNLYSYLFGNILAIPREELFYILIFDIVIISFVTTFYKELQAITFDEEFSYTRGVNVDLIYLILFIFVALTTVLLIRVVGIMLVVALLSIPSAISLKYSKSLKHLFAYSVLIGMIINISGLIISFYFNLPSGATIILVGGILYFISFFKK